MNKNPLNTYMHVATIFRRGVPIVTARNRAASRSTGGNAHTMHAEVAVVKKLGDLSLLQGCVLRVERYHDRDGHVMNSKPCHDCEMFLTKMIKKWRLKSVEWST
jgi:hypothetical protein